MKKIKTLFKAPNFYLPAILFILVLLSRLLLLNGSIDFFDSTQYIWRSELPTLKEALSTGHAPYHPGYIFFTWIIYQIFKLFGTPDTSLVAAIPSAIFGSLTILFFYLLVKKIFDAKIAFLSVILATLIPFFWISNISIIVDPTMICFYILSLYLFYLWLDEKNYYYLIISSFSLGFSMWTHTQIAFWCLSFVALFFYKIKFKDYLKIIIKSIPFIIGPVFFIGVYLYLLVGAGHNPNYIDALKYLFTGNAGDHMPFSFFPGVRNYTIIMTTLVAGFSVLGIVKMLLDKKYDKFFMIVIWLFPGLFLSALYLYANLYGRSSMIAIFPGVTAVSYFLLSWKAKNLVAKVVQASLIILTLCQLLWISLPVIKTYATQPAALEELAKFHKELKPGGLYITSNQAKTIYYYRQLGGKIDIIWEMPKEKIDQDINQAVLELKPLYIGQDAIMFPYYIYDGHNWEIKSTDIGGPSEHNTLASNYFSDFNFILEKVSKLKNKTAVYNMNPNDINFKQRLKQSVQVLPNNQSLIFGRLIDSNTDNFVARSQINIYSNQPQYIISPERINWRDWIFYLYNWVVFQNHKSYDKIEPLIFNYSDRQGYFSMVLPIDQSDSLNLIATNYNLSTNDIFPDGNQKIAFVPKNSQELNIIDQKIGQTKSLEEICNLIDNSRSYYLKLNKNDDHYQYKINYFDYNINLVQKIASTLLPSQSEEIVNDPTSELQNVRVIKKGKEGYLIFGPWIKLNPGAYKINFKIKVDGVKKNDKNIGYIEVKADKHQKSIAQKELRISDFKSGEYQDINLNFHSKDNLNGVEFRLYSNGFADIYLDNISINQK